MSRGTVDSLSTLLGSSYVNRSHFRDGNSRSPGTTARSSVIAVRPCTVRRVELGQVMPRYTLEPPYTVSILLSLSLLSPSILAFSLRCALSPSLPLPFHLFLFVTSSFSFSLEQVSAPLRQFALRSSQRSLNEREPVLLGADGEGSLRDSNSTSGELGSREQRDALLRACVLCLCPYSTRLLSTSQWFLIREMRDNPFSPT